MVSPAMFEIFQSRVLSEKIKEEAAPIDEQL